MSDAPLICIACQNALSGDEFVYVGKTTLRVCRSCWNRIPLEARVRLGIAVQDREEGGAIDAARKLIEAMTLTIRERDLPPEWLRGSSDN